MYKKSNLKENVLIAGIAGASLGTEILKSLVNSNNYNIYGTDISPYAYGLYQKEFKKTFIICEGKYIAETLAIAKKEKIRVIIPGGEKPLLLLSKHRSLFENEGIILAINNANVIELCIDKSKTFQKLKKLGIPIPRTELFTSSKQLAHFAYPCIVKPSSGSGGSISVHLVANQDEAYIICQDLIKKNIQILIQEYINQSDEEYTVGVLSDSNEKIIKSIPMKRIFSSKLSYVSNQEGKIISSGYSQGEFDYFKDVCLQAEKIAISLKSTGPLNIQGRLKNGIFYPFEINPRFSATTYLRTIVGFNEIDVYIQYLLTGKIKKTPKIKQGYCFRSLIEQFITKEQLL